MEISVVNEVLSRPFGLDVFSLEITSNPTFFSFYNIFLLYYRLRIQKQSEKGFLKLCKFDMQIMMSSFQTHFVSV